MLERADWTGKGLFEPGRECAVASETPEPSEIRCLICEAVLARWDAAQSKWQPSAEELHASGRVAVPNAGWFCSQECGLEFERRTGLHLQGDLQGRIEYYPRADRSPGDS